jgi:hypothetical protein
VSPLDGSPYQGYLYAYPHKTAYRPLRPRPALPAHLAEARALRDALPADVYLWVNAAEGQHYTAEQETDWSAVDPLFGYSVRPHPSAGAPCRAGETVISVRGDGRVRQRRAGWPDPASGRDRPFAVPVRPAVRRP